MHEVHRHQDGAQIKLRLLHEFLKEMVQVQDADDVVDGILIDRDAGIWGIVCRFQHFLPVILDVDGKHVHTRRDDLIGQHIAKVERALQKLRPVLIDDAFVFNRLKDRLKVILRNGGAAFPKARPNAVQQHEELVEHPHDGLCDEHHHPERQRDKLREALRQLHGNDLRDDLAKGEDQHRHHRRSGPRALIPEERHGNQRCHRGGSDVHKVVADEDRNERRVVCLVDPVRGFCGKAAALRRVFHAQRVQRGIADLRAGEERRKGDQQHDQKVGAKRCFLHQAAPP